MHSTITRKKHWWVSILSVMLLFAVTAVGQQTYTWALPTAGSWHVTNNWEPNTGIPLERDTAIIDQGEVRFGSTVEAVCSELTLGESTGSTGRMLMDLTGAQLHPQGTMILGKAGIGTVVQTKGEICVYDIGQGGTLCMGSQPGSFGVYRLEGGTLGPWSNTMIVGCEGTGQFTQIGGTSSFTLITLASEAGGTGYLDLSGGELSSDGWVWVGSRGRGTFVQSAGTTHLLSCIGVGEYSGSFGLCELSGGIMDVPDVVWIGEEQNAEGRFMMSTGTIPTTLVSYDLCVGLEGRGTFIQTGGSAATIRAATVGYGSWSTGLLQLEGGSLVVGTTEDVGYYGVGTFEQGGGQHQVYGNLCVGTVEGDGAYTLSNGTLWVGGEEAVGHGGLGTFAQTGGWHVVPGTLTVAKYSDSEGRYDLSGGTLVAGTLAVEIGGTGYFKQTGGSVHVSGTLHVGRWYGQKGTYELNNALNNATLNAGTISGYGVFLLSGGSYTPPLGTFGPNLVNTGGVLRAGGWWAGTVYFASNAGYTQGTQGTLDVSIRGQGNTSDSLVGLATCTLDGLVHMDCAGNRPRECTLFPIIVASVGITTGSVTITTDLILGPDPSFTDPNDPSFWEPSLSGGTYFIRMRGLTAGDATADHAVDGGDLAILGGNWGKSGMTWGQADFTGEGVVDGGDLALLGGNWNWSCPEHYQGGRGEDGKMHDGGLDLSDRDGDGDFDVDDMLIIIKEMNDPSKKAPEARDNSPEGIPTDVLFETWTDDEIRDEADLADSYLDSAEDGDLPGLDGAPPGWLPPGTLPPPLPAPPADPSTSSDLPPAGRLDNPTDTVALATGMDSPLLWAGCWMGSVGLLFRPRRRAV